MRAKWPFYKLAVVCMSMLMMSGLWQNASAQTLEGDINSAIDSLSSETSLPNAEDLARDPHKYYRDQIQSVLNGKDFTTQQKVKRWRLKEQFKTEKKDKSEDSADSSWLDSLDDFFSSIDSISKSFATVIKIIFIAVFIGFIVFILYKYKDSISHVLQGFHRTKTQQNMPTEMFGLDVRKEALPTDIVASAQSLWQEGQHRDGLGLLLQGTLSKLLHEHECIFQAGDTETDCCKVVAELENENLHSYMLQLTQGWQQLAYAHQVPTAQTFSSLCSGWQELFDAR